MSALPEAQSEAGGRSDCVVMKFGGTSVQDADAIRQLTRLVRRSLPSRAVVVVSALARVTDQLLGAGRAAAEGHLGSAQEMLQLLEKRHERVCGELVEDDDFQRLRAEIQIEFQLLDGLVGNIAEAAEFSPRAQDHLLGLGESLSSKIVRAALSQSGLGAVCVDAKDCIITNDAHTRATPLWQETNQRIEEILNPLLEAGRVPVLGGFVGATREGIPTTLGRGGSDFSAAIVAAALCAKRIEIWTDVDGIMTADPNLCPDARRVARMSFDEAAELAYFGAKVLHPATLLPAMRRDIPVWVLNSRNSECPGTEILAHSGDHGRVKAITVKRGVAVVDVEPMGWLAPELLREVCEVFERHQHPLELLSASRGSLSLLLSSPTAQPAIAEELKGLASLRWENHKALVCLVGEKIRRRPELASQAFDAISGIDSRLICQGASERNISFLVDESKAEESVRRLHSSFFSPPEVSAASDLSAVEATP